MAVFSKKVISELMPQKEDLNIKYLLPFAKKNDEYTSTDFMAKWIDYDKYQVIVYNTNNNAMWMPTNTTTGTYTITQTTQNSSTYGGYLSGMNSSSANRTSAYNIVDAITMQQIVNGVNLPLLGLYRISKEDDAKLALLEKEREQFKKLKRIQKFKELPATLRQDVVNAIMLETLYTTFEIKDSEFEGNDEIIRLRTMVKPVTNYSGYASAGFSMNMNMDNYLNTKYGAILNYLTKEEILAAHAEAAFEEEVLE